jgi:anaerobic selenocysteine-containing dehydrogenase
MTTKKAGNSCDPRQLRREIGEETSTIIGVGLAGGGPGGSASVADIKNGKIVRLRPLHYDWKYDKEQFNPWQLEARGKTFEPRMKALPPVYGLAYKKRIYSPNRILYPLKRIDWDPNGERNPQNRGKSGYIRISWDEATNIIAREIKRIHKTYGHYALLAQCDGHGETKVVHKPHGCNEDLLKLMGGYTLQTRNTDSWEGWNWGAKHAWGMSPVGLQGPGGNLIPDVAEHTDLLLFWGCDPETTPGGQNGLLASRLCYWFTELRIKSVYICPDLNYGAAVHADKWIPIRPGTDAALQLAIAYIWITEELYDKGYIATHTTGYDKFADYVLGQEDGVPKTPEWASHKCAIPEWTIKALAREWASRVTSICHGNGGPGIRSAYSTENARLEVLLLTMQGVGKPGVHQVKMLEWQDQSGSNPLPGSMGSGWLVVNSEYLKSLCTVSEAVLKPPERPGQSGAKSVSLPQPPKQFIPKDLIHDALLKAPISWYGITSAHVNTEDQFVKYSYPVEGCSEVHMIWTDSPCWITCWNDSNSYIKGLRSTKIEFILAQHPWLENDCLFADIILPVTTKFEENDIGVDSGNGQFLVMLDEKKCVEPLGESKSDYEAVCLIAEKLGLLKEYTGGKTIEELKTLVFKLSDARKMTTYQELTDKGYFVIPTDPDWQKQPVGMRDFYADPEKYPLETPSGKIEFCSQNLTRHFPNDRERPPVPHWVEKGESHDERLSSIRARKYPLLQVSNHPRWRMHANCDDITWTREVPTCKVKGPDGYLYEPLWLNPQDAAERGIKSGDIVKVYNERGAVLGAAYVTERLIPGAVSMDHGARYDAIIPGELDRGGAINTITPHKTTSKNATGMAVSSFLVEVEKVTMAQMAELQQQYPEAFKREYDPASGLRFDAWVEKC